MELLTVKDVAALKGCSERYIKKLALGNELEHLDSVNANGKKKYLIPLAALDEPLQRKWYRQRGAEIPDELRDKVKSKPGKEPKPLEAYTLQQREQIDYWISMLDRWWDFRKRYQGNVDEADAAFIEQERLKVSAKTLYRRRAALMAGDMDGLIEKRGIWRKGQSDIPPEVWRVFLTYYLDQARHPVSRCVKYTQDYLKLREPEALANIPGIGSFYRQIENDVPVPVKVYNREGKKVLHDRWAPYIRRIYDGMMSNDYWVADNHTFDFMSLGENGRPHRLYLTAFLDARSTVIVGWQVTNNPCGDATLSALRKGIQPPGGRPANGIPDNIYVDNGSEFLVHDIGGRGHRKRKSNEDVIEPPGVFKRLGINMVNAIPGNPEAKIIERIFRDFKDMLSRAIETFCGGTIAERPERLSGLLKSGNIISDEEVVQVVDEFIEGYYNHLPYNGAVKKDHGKPKIQVYNENLARIRVPQSLEDLNLMMMRSSRPVKVGKRGVKLTIAGYAIDYWTDDFLLNWQGKQIYYRYDPDDLSSIRVYTIDDKYICSLPADDIAVSEYGANSDDIKQGMQKINKYNKVVKEWTDGKILGKSEKVSVYTLMRIQARENLSAQHEYMERGARVIDFVQASEDTYEYPMASGDDSAMLSVMIENARQYIGEENGYGQE